MHFTYRPELIRGLSILTVVTIVHAILVLTASYVIAQTDESTSGIKIIESAFVVAVQGIGQSPEAAPIKETISEPEPMPQDLPEPTPAAEDIQPDPAPDPPLMSVLEEDPVKVDNHVAEKSPEPKRVENKTSVEKPVVRQTTRTLKQAPGQPESGSTSGQGVSTAGESDIVMPITHADYLNNPHPSYPRISRRLREEGRVLLAVEIDIDGHAAQILVKHSSGYERLDQSALQTVLKWRFVPGKQAGVAKKMWVNIPINFVLE